MFVGLGLAAAIRWLLIVLPCHPADSALVLVMPFVGYLAADRAHGSGVLAVVSVALALNRHSDSDSDSDSDEPEKHIPH